MVGVKVVLTKAGADRFNAETDTNLKSAFGSICSNPRLLYPASRAFFGQISITLLQQMNRKTFLAMVVLALMVFTAVMLLLLAGPPAARTDLPNVPERSELGRGKDEQPLPSAKKAAKSGIRPNVADHLPSGYELTEMESGRVIVKVPNKGFYSASGVTAADRGLVFKGPIAFSLSESGPWVGYADDATVMFMDGKGATKLSGRSALVREEPSSATEVEEAESR